MKKLKVLHLIESLGSGGAERLLHTNLKHLDGTAIENRVITAFSAGDFWKQPIESLGVPVSSLNCSSIRSVGIGLVRFLKLLKASKPDLIHTHLWTANIIGRIAGSLTRVPVISSIHNPEYEPDALLDSAKMNRAKVSISRVADKLTASFGCDRMIAVSKYVKDSTINHLGYPSDKIDVLYNPIETSDLTSVQHGTDIREELLIPPVSHVLLTVGRLVPQKGFIYAVRAMPEILSRYPDARLISIGGQTDARWLAVVKAEIEKLGLQEKVLLLGERRDIPRFLSQADLFVFPSLFEGLGIALAEAMAAGCACVASNTGPIPEFIDNGLNGMLVSPRDPAEIGRAVRLLLGDVNKRRVLGKAARETAMKVFEPISAAQALSEIYYSVARRGK